MSQPGIRVLCVDDHRLIRVAIARIVEVETDMSIVAEAADGDEAVAQFRRHVPDVTIMDLNLPRMSGLEATRTIKREFPDARIIVLTMYQGDEDIYRALDAGAVGYVLKDVVGEDLVNLIRAVHGGARVVPPEIEAVLVKRSSNPSLTQREIQVLALLATGKRNKEIGADLGVSNATASAHVKSIFAKFNVHDRTAAVAEGVRRGIIHFD